MCDVGGEHERTQAIHSSMTAPLMTDSLLPHSITSRLPSPPPLARPRHQKDTSSPLPSSSTSVDPIDTSLDRLSPSSLSKNTIQRHEIYNPYSILLLEHAPLSTGRCCRCCLFLSIYFESSSSIKNENISSNKKCIIIIETRTTEYSLPWFLVSTPPNEWSRNITILFLDRRGV
jgi:hypothetical protein